MTITLQMGIVFEPIEFLRGVFSNWWDQGADNIVTFNWSYASPEATKKVGIKTRPNLTPASLP